MASERKFYGWHLVAALWVIYLINVGYAMYGASVERPWVWGLLCSCCSRDCPVP